MCTEATSWQNVKSLANADEGPAAECLNLYLLQVLLDGVIAKPDSSIWELPFLTSEDHSMLNGVRGVPSHIIPSNASAKTAKPKILSPKGYQLPPEVPGKFQEPLRGKWNKLSSIYCVRS